MERKLFQELYQQANELVLKDCPSASLSGLLHGYLSVYSMVQVYPWLEDEFGSPWEIHERVRRITQKIGELLKGNDIPVDVRVGYIVDMMDAYLLYSDLNTLNVALDYAYEILLPAGSNKIVLPCRTPNVCRLLCNCFYFTGEEECGMLAKSLMTEALGLSRKMSWDELLAWWEAIRVYESIIGEMDLSTDEQIRLAGERARWRGSVEQAEDEKIECFLHKGNRDNACALVGIFDILAKREFDVCNEKFCVQ